MSHHKATTQQIEEIWFSTWRRHSSKDLCEAAQALKAIRSRYGEPWRHYHTWEHIKDLCGHFTETHYAISNADIVFLSIIYHDIIYDPRSVQNENLSARLAQWELEKYGFPPFMIEMVCEYIEKTDHKNPHPSHDLDLRFILDADLASLGYDESIFVHNRKILRREHDYLSDAEFTAGTEIFFKKLLERKRLYHLPVFIKAYAKQTQRNLSRIA